MAECSGTRERRMSEELTSATRRQKKSSNFMASPSNSGKNENRICCPTPMMISPSGINESGRASRNPAKVRGPHQPAIPQPSVLGLVKPDAAYREERLPWMSEGGDIREVVGCSTSQGYPSIRCLRRLSFARSTTQVTSSAVNIRSTAASRNSTVMSPVIFRQM
jgi:hypothetical protein